LKHRLKLFLRELYARILFHTGLHALVDRLMPRRLTILAGHCVGGAPGENGENGADGAQLPADMTISSERLETILGWFARRYEMCTIAEGLREIDGGARGRSLVALSMDDGYRDNHDRLLGLLGRTGARATVFLESRPLDERRVNWSHKYFWLLARMSPWEFVHRYGELCGGSAHFHAMNQVVTEGRLEPRYHLKRILKYEAEPLARDRAIDAIFAEQGGDERALCEALYMGWEQARAMQASGVELGGHTVSHEILSRLAPEEQVREISGGAEAMERALGQRPVTFAYPWGRRWDFDGASREAVRRAGFQAAVTMHAGTVGPRSERTALARLAIDDQAELHLLAAEACGGLELLRRIGLDLSE
jgi:peptidoglycan/xylan/chitin deacetylase (PgdA/CDA1 family)